AEYRPRVVARAARGRCAMRRAAAALVADLDHARRRESVPPRVPSRAARLAAADFVSRMALRRTRSLARRIARDGGRPRARTTCACSRQIANEGRIGFGGCA